MAKKSISLDKNNDASHNYGLHPTLSLHYSKHLNDFEVENIQLTVIGENSEITRKNMEWLLNKTSLLRNGTNKKKGLVQ